MTTVIASGSFDNLRSRHVRFLEEAAKLGELHVLLWSDEVARRLEGRAPRFPQAERQYLVEAVRYVNRVTLVTELDSPDALPEAPALKRRAEKAKGAEAPWASAAARRSRHLGRGRDRRHPGQARFLRGPRPRLSRLHRRRFGRISRGTGVRGQGSGIRTSVVRRPSSFVRRPSVIVTGCYDWLHSGHVRFFEEASSYGDLIVAAGNDANVRNLKGEGHPLQTQEERRYMIGAIRYVKLALITTGWGWLDAEPEIARLKPDIYLVNEDGDKPEKREFCETHGLRYVVLKRTPKEGLPRRSSTDLRGF